MSGLESDIPVGVEAPIISSTLNSFIVSILLIGMYTVLYFGTIYVYYTKNSSKYHLVPAAITMLYLSNMAETAVQWYLTKWQFIDNGDTRQSVFLAILFDSPSWCSIALSTVNGVIFVITDGLLIWRCFYVWDRSFRIILVPLFLFISEIGLFLVFISLFAKYIASNGSLNLVTGMTDVLSTAYFTSLATTLLTTVLIGYRIYSISKQQSASFRRFKHIIDIVVQSGAVYALSQFITAVAGIIPGSNTLNEGNIALTAYTQLLNAVIAGISATIVVARVALLSVDATYPSTSIHLSGLQFHAHNTHPTDAEAMVITHFVEGNRISAPENQAIEAKVQ